MSYTLIFYILFCILVGLGGTMTLFRMERALAAAVFLVMSILIFVFFGLRWFTYAVGSTIKWPPVVNTCPDYLTSYQRTIGGKPVTACVDLIGVSKNAALAVFPSTGTAPTDNKFYFPMCVNPNGRLTDKGDKLCEYTTGAGLSWDGLVNGMSCIKENNPNGLAAKKEAICGSQ